MSQYYALPDAENGFSAAVTSFCKKLLESGAVEAVMAPQRLPNNPMVHHTLVQDASKLNNVDPSAPVMNINGGTLAARLTRQDPGGKIGMLLRPCELRAYAELVKLNQGDRDYVLLIGTDCYGTFEPPAFQTWAENASNGNGAFLDAVRSSDEAPKDAPEIRKNCRACEYPTPDIADIQIQLMGVDGAGAVTSGTEAGAAVLSELGLSEQGEPANREKAVGDIVAKRTAVRDALFEEVRTELLPMEKILNELSRCINCYNCRDACPVCYCRSCVFDGQTFEHPSSQYFEVGAEEGRRQDSHGHPVFPHHQNGSHEHVLRGMRAVHERLSHGNPGRRHLPHGRSENAGGLRLRSGQELRRNPPADDVPGRGTGAQVRIAWVKSYKKQSIGGFARSGGPTTVDRRWRKKTGKRTKRKSWTRRPWITILSRKS